VIAREELVRFGRFLVVGGGLFAIDFALFVALAEPLGVPLAQGVSVTVRTIVGFFAHKWFTFRGDTSDDPAVIARQGVAYVVQGVLNAPVSVAVVAGCVWLLDGWVAGGKVLSEGVLVFEVFALYRVFVYSRRWFGAAE
jgi:putative flippase GtrA